MKNLAHNIPQARVNGCAHLDIPRTASSRCVLDDGDIAATVRDAIDCTTMVPEGALQVEAKNGWVTLRGTLNSWLQRHSVEYLALHAVGVRGVVNSITVEEKPIPILLFL
jgi:osmotically-inducible protein OsmY